MVFGWRLDNDLQFSRESGNSRPQLALGDHDDDIFHVLPNVDGAVYYSRESTEA